MDNLQPNQPASPQSATRGAFARISPVVEVQLVVQQPAVRSHGSYPRLGKRVVDTLGASIGLVLTSPLLLVCAVAVRLDSRGPIFYRQRRVGQYGRTFQIFKFRTMIDDADKQGAKFTASGDARITRVGRLLRRAKLDEIPQLLNVLRGEMSLVGPRPEVPEYAEQYTAQEEAVLWVRPGITGPASLAYIDEEHLLASASDQENFYVHTIMRRKLQFDLGYCRNVCLLEDARLILRTAANLVSRRRFEAPR